MVIIGPLDKVVQSMYQRDDVKNLSFFSILCQTPQLFNEYGVDIFNNYKGFDKKRNFEYIMKKINKYPYIIRVI